MKKFILLFLLGSIHANAAEINEQERMLMLQKMQHSRPNAAAYVNSLQKQEAGPQTYQTGRGGHFYLPVTINGRQLEMMADTGASSIFLSQEDAVKMGINLSNLNYNIPYDTANGKIYAAQINAPRLQVGDISLENVPITIAQNRNNEMSLLGMEFFSRLSKYEVKDGKLTLYK